MTQNILIIQNNSSEGPGILGEILRTRKINYTIIDLKQGQTISNDLNYQAVIVLGGPNSANDQDSQMLQELAFVQKVIASQIPYLGICLGLQVLVKAAGGSVLKMPEKEIGFRHSDSQFYTISLIESGKQDRLFKGLNQEFRVLQLHGETVELTKSMQLLGTGVNCKNQIVKIGTNAYGIQCHFELTDAMFEIWIKHDDDLKKLPANLLRLDFLDIRDHYTDVGQKLFENFLEIAGISSSSISSKNSSGSKFLQAV